MQKQFSSLALALVVSCCTAGAQTLPKKAAAPAQKATAAKGAPAGTVSFKTVGTAQPKFTIDLPSNAAEKVINDQGTTGKLWQGASKGYAYIVQSMLFKAPISSTPAAGRVTLTDEIYKSMVKGFTEGTGGKAQLQFDKNITVNGVSGRDYKVSSSSKFGKMRCFVLDNGMIALFVLGADPGLTAAARTVNSLKPVN